MYSEQEGEQFVKKIGGVFAFKVKDGPNGQEATWFVDVKNGNGCVHNDTGKRSRRPGILHQMITSHDISSAAILTSVLMSS